MDASSNIMDGKRASSTHQRIGLRKSRQNTRRSAVFNIGTGNEWKMGYTECWGVSSFPRAKVNGFTLIALSKAYFCTLNSSSPVLLFLTELLVSVCFSASFSDVDLKGSSITFEMLISNAHPRCHAYFTILEPNEPTGNDDILFVTK